MSDHLPLMLGRVVDNCGDPTDCFATGESFTEALIGLAVTTVVTLLMFTLVGRLLSLVGMLAARLALVASLGRFGAVGRFFGFGLSGARGSAAARAAQAARAGSVTRGVPQVRPTLPPGHSGVRPSSPPPQRPPPPGELPPGLRRPELPPDLRPPPPGRFDRLPEIPPEKTFPGSVARVPARDLPDVEFPGTPGSGLPKTRTGKILDVVARVLDLWSGGHASRGF